MSSFVLFVARNRRRTDELCPGSTLCSEFLQNVDAREVEVVDCNRSDVQRPPWLRGTPTLYEHETARTWTGHEAVRRLYHMSLHYAASPPAPSQSSSATARGRPQGVIPSSSSTRPQPPPPEDGSPADAVDESIWTSQITPDMEDASQETETRSDRKMTGDDLQRAMSQRMMSTGVNANGDPPQTMNAPPPPPPALHD